MTEPQSAGLTHPHRYPLLALVRSLVFSADQTERQSLVVCLGSRGSGKTTFLTYLAAAFAEESRDSIVVGPFDASKGSADAYIQHLKETRDALPGGDTRILVLLDNLDILTHTPKAAALDTLEAEVLADLVQQPNVTVVATSRTPITWRDWETRSRNQVVLLPYLDREEVGREAAAQGIDPDRAFMSTLGHPRLLTWLLADPPLSEAELATRAAPYFLEGLPVATSEYATMISLLPNFDVAVLRAVAPVEGTQVAEGFLSQYLDRLHELLVAGILTWSTQTGAYRFLDAVVRCQLARSFRARRPDDAYRIHQLAASYFQAEARRVGVLQFFIVDVIYHLAYAAALAGAERPGQAALAWVEANREPWAAAPWAQVLEAWQTGAGDPVVKDDLRRLMGPEDTARLTSLLEAGQAATAGPDDISDDTLHATEKQEQEVVS